MCQYIFCIGIRLERDGECYPNGSYFWDQNVISNSLSCILPDETGTGEWVRVEGNDAVDCNNNNDSDPFRCTNDTSPNTTISLYLAQGLPADQEGFYKCCLPTDCSSANNTITVNIFSKKV